MSKLDLSGAVILGEQPKVNVVNIQRQELPAIYQDLKTNNDLLRRIEVEKKSQGWTDLEVRTAQLQVAVASNASLQRRLQEMQTGLLQTMKAG